MTKYEKFPEINLSDRTWPSKIIEKAPIWCNVDLRDGNQALVNPMNPANKLKWFEMITSIGFKEIEISFPSASQQDYDFTRLLIEENHIPDDVTIQVLTQARDHLIYETFKAISGAKQAIIHIYNSTSPAQRKMVFGKSNDEIIDIAIEGVKLIRELADKSGSKIILEYSPESFSQTELPFAAEICKEVVNAWNPSIDEQVIINLPSTVEVTPPNIYADQIEYMCRQFEHYQNIIISVHTHNDRGCAVAAAELAQCAGAKRVEGTIFGNGERTGNADIVTLALNCFVQGIDPKLNFYNMPQICSMYTKCTGMTIPVRQPYAGELVFTAFSGSHQDAISKSLSYHSSNGGTWNIPYLPIDPLDIGRDYQSIIRINSQSGKGGAAYILEKNYGIYIPREMHSELGKAIKFATSAYDGELLADDVYSVFIKTFFDISGPFQIFNITRKSVSETDTQNKQELITTIVESPFGPIQIESETNLFIKDLQNTFARLGINFTIMNSDNKKHEIQLSQFLIYIQVTDKKGAKHFGASLESDVILATLNALCAALNKQSKEVAFLKPEIRSRSEVV